MSCSDLTNDLLLDPAAPGTKAHLAGCSACRSRAAELRALGAALAAAAPPAEPDPALVRRIVGRLRSSPRRIVMRPASPLRWVAAAAAAVAVALVLVLATREPAVEEAPVARPVEKPPIEIILDPVPPPPLEVPKVDPPTEAPRPLPPAPKPLPPPVETPRPPEPPPPTLPAPPAPKPAPTLPAPAESRPARVFLALSSVEGGVELNGRKAEKGSEWEKDQVLRAGERLSRVQLSDGTRLSLKPRVELRLEAADAMALDRGEIFCEVAPGAGRTFAILTPDARIEATGTQFSVSRSDHTEIVVSAGEVRVSNDRGAVAVPAGSGTTARKSAAPARPRPVDPDAMTAWRRGPESPRFHYDFEDGRRPVPWQDGKVGAGPARGFNKGSLEGAPGINLDLSRIDRRVSTVKGTLKLRFRYYATGGDVLWAQLMDERVRDNFRFEVRNLVHNKWETFEAPLSEFFLLIDGAAKIQEGDRLTWFNVSISGTTGPVYFDDIELVEVLK